MERVEGIEPYSARIGRPATYLMLTCVNLTNPNLQSIHASELAGQFCDSICRLLSGNPGKATISYRSNRIYIQSCLYDYDHTLSYSSFQFGPHPRSRTWFIQVEESNLKPRCMRARGQSSPVWIVTWPEGKDSNLRRRALNVPVSWATRRPSGKTWRHVGDSNP